MECFAVYADEIEGRLDCFFYRPANRIKIKSKHPIKIIEDIISKIIHPPEYKRIYSQSGYQLLRAQNVRPYRINITTNQVFFDKEFVSGNTLIFPEIGDVLVVRSGVNTGDCAVIDKNYKDVLLGADNLVCKCKEELSPKYLMIYLSSDFGKKLLAKYITGATNSHITPQNLGKIQIPIPPLETQNKIVQLMDKAYSQKKEKESKAQQLLDSINDYVLSELGITQPPDEKKTCYSIYSDEIEGRFDPHFYRPEFRILEENLSKLNHKNLSSIIKFSNETWNQKDFFENEFPYIEISEIDITSGDIQNITYYEKSKAPSRAKMIVREKDIIISTTRPHRGAITLIDKDKDGFIASTGFAILREPKIKINREYLLSFLRTQLALKQMLQRSSGGNYPAITSEELKNIIVPLPPLETQNKIAEEVKARMQKAEQLQKEAKEVFEEAKERVERIILGEQEI